jgi:hypothetical protein
VCQIELNGDLLTFELTDYKNRKMLFIGINSSFLQKGIGDGGILLNTKEFYEELKINK